MKIEDVEMTTRTYNLLKLNGINNMKDLSEISEDEIIRWRNLGRRVVENACLHKKENEEAYLGENCGKQVQKIL